MIVPVSVVMPVRNEASFIARSVGSVLAQEYPAALLEVFVVDGMSADGTRQIVQQIIERDSSVNLVLLDNPARVVPNALNIGVRHARGEVIIILGGHSEIAPDYVRKCLEVLHESGADCVGGALTAVGETVAARAISLAQSAHFGVGGVAFRTGRRKSGSVDTVAYGAYRRRVFQTIGGFDEELVRNQDDEFNFRLLQAGGTIWFDPTIRSVYHSRASFRNLWRQYLQYGFYKVRVIQKRGAVPSWRHLVPAAFVTAIILAVLLAVGTGNAIWSLGVLGLYGAASIVASVLAARKNWRSLPLIPVAFATLHVGYGTGFLAGLWHWRKKWRAGSEIAAGRIFDIGAAITGLILLSPVFLVVAVSIKMRSAGPVLFKARRVGKDGKLIDVYKFRTMVHDGVGRGPAITAKGDSRVTPVGRILRRTKLDELPQLINVLTGDMSIVGPRPEDPRYVELYSPEQRRVLSVKPGITSAASVRYRKEEELLVGDDWEAMYRTRILPEKLAIDLEYIEQRSLWSDIKVIARTVRLLRN